MREYVEVCEATKIFDGVRRRCSKSPNHDGEHVSNFTIAQYTSVAWSETACKAWIRSMDQKVYYCEKLGEHKTHSCKFENMGARLEWEL